MLPSFMLIAENALRAGSTMQFELLHHRSLHCRY